MYRTLAALLIVSLPLSAGAATVDLVFEPPVVTPGAVCAQRPTDEALVAKWQGYSDAALPEGDTGLIKRDLRRLLEMDPQRWFDVVNAAQAQLKSVDPSYSQANILIDRIELLLAAGRVPQLLQERLVEQLAGLDLTQTPRAQLLLSGYLIGGIGIAQDRETGEAMLLSAAFGGNADAILTLVERDVEGKPVAGWTVPPDLGVTMAFGALVGKLDRLICDRVNRIAREYNKGTIVTRDVALTERWYKFAADPGDALSAWKVAETQLRSEDVRKDNTVLLHDLTAAADGGLPYAQVALGRIQAAGALMPRDIVAAEASCRAADNGIRAQGAASQALFLQDQARKDATWTPRYLEALHRLAASDAAPAWALIAEADWLLDDTGRRAGQDQASVFLERAAARGEYAAVERLAALRFRMARTPAEFYAVTDSMIQLVVASGEVDPMVSLSNAFICRAPDAPQVAEADYWVAVATSTATAAVDFSPAQLDVLATTRDPIAEAEIQTQALTGRVTAIAQYICLLEKRGATPEAITFWLNYATGFPGVTTARAALAFKAARTPAQREAALTTFQEAVRIGEASAGAQFAKALLKDGLATPDSQAEALGLLLRLADKGVGDAMAMLPLADADQFPALDVVFDRYAPVIAARGDFDALLLALPSLTDPDEFADYLNRASSITGCTFDDAMRLADAIGKAGAKTGDPVLFDRWLRIAACLAGTNPVLLADLGDLLGSYGTTADQPAVLAYCEAARAGGSRAAVHRLLNVCSRRNAPLYDPELWAELYVDLVRFSGPEDMPATLSRLRTATPEIRAIAARSIDEPSLYLSAAQSENPVAMREYALSLRENATTPAQVVESTDWLRRAADAGEPAAMTDLAEAPVFGIGTVAAREEALVWLQKASDLGSAEAPERLRSLQLTSEVGQ